MDMSNMQAMLAQAREMSDAASEQLAQITVEGSAGGGAGGWSRRCPPAPCASG